MPCAAEIGSKRRPSLGRGGAALFCVLVGVDASPASIWLAVVALSPGGFGAVDLLLVILFAITLPWYVIGFWNATIGLLIMRFARDPVAAVTPVVGRVRGDEPITASTAILVCIRNEPPERVVRHLAPMLEGLATHGVRRPLPCLCAERHQRACRRRGRGSRLSRRSPTAWRGRIADHLPAPRAQHRLQGRQHPRFLRSLGQQTTTSPSCSTPTAS